MDDFGIDNDVAMQETVKEYMVKISNDTKTLFEKLRNIKENNDDGVHNI